MAFAAITLNHGALITHLLPLLAERGIAAEAAVVAASMIGPMQITGRLALMAAGERAPALVVAAAAFLVMTLAAVCLWATAFAPVMVVAFIVLQGAGYGVTSVVRPLVVAALFGRERYGVVAGSLAVFLTGGFALSPTAAAMLWSVAGYGPVVLAAGGISLVGGCALLLAWRTGLARAHQD